MAHKQENEEFAALTRQILNLELKKPKKKKYLGECAAVGHAQTTAKQSGGCL